MKRLKQVQDRSSRNGVGYAPLLRALFANLTLGLAQGHIQRNVAKMLVERVMRALETEADRRGGFGALGLDFVYKRMTTELVRLGPDTFYQRKKPLDCTPVPFAVTVQPSFALQFWLNKKFSGARKKKPTAPDLVRLCRAVKKAKNRINNASVGIRGEVLWLTPMIDEVLDKVSESQRAAMDQATRNENATRLRNLLGLWRRKPNQHLVAAITACSVGDLCQGPATGPTIFDARDYERFRAWPSQGSENIGRTFELDPVIRRRAGDEAYGAPEFINPCIDFDGVSDVAYLGQISYSEGDVHKSEAARDFAAHVEFADELCRGRTLHDLIDDLAILL